MKILTAVKRTIDANVRIHVKSDHSGVDLDNVKMAMNPFCEIAVEEAVRLKEQGRVAEVVAVTIGPEKSEDVLRHAMALGADRAIRVPSESLLDPLDVAGTLARIAAREEPGLILMGKQAIDSDNNQVGQMLAGLCGYGQGTFAFRLDLQDDRVLVGREVDGGEQVIELKLPAVVTTDLRLNQPRYARLPDIMKAKKKTVETLTLEELGVEVRERLRTLGVHSPPGRGGGVMVSDAEELVDRLRNEAKVLP